MTLQTKYVLTGIVIGLLVGAGAGYIYGQSPIAGYKEEVDRLKTENLGIREKKAQLLEENTALQDQLGVLTENITITRSLLEEVQGKLEETKKDYGYLGQKYADLINLLNITEVKGYTQTINYTIYSGNEETWLFYLPYGAIWEAKICLSYDYCDMSHAWRQGELRTFAGSSGRGLSQYGLKGIPFLTGTITCEYYDDGGSTIYVTCTILSQYPELVRTAGDWISKTSENNRCSSLKPPVIDGFADEREWPTFQELNLEYWKTFNSEPWDTENKTILVSTVNYISHLYLCFKIPDDYVSEDFKIDSVQIYLDDGSGMVDSRFMLWDIGREYRQNSWITDGYKISGEGEHDWEMGGTTDGMGQYSHTSGGSLGEEGIYTVELDLPLRAATDDIYDSDAKPGEPIYIEIHFAEVKEWTEEGTFYGSSYWKSKPSSITFTNP